LLSKFQQFKVPLCAGRATPRATKHVGEDLAAQEAFAASVEWIMVRMNLLAYYK
jgi:hypothetical protein